MPFPERNPQIPLDQFLTPSSPLSQSEFRDQRWTQAAIEGELNKLPDSIASEDINKAESPFFASLIKIAAVVKGSGQPFLSPDQVLEVVKAACNDQKWLREKEIERQWKNAYKLAEPRFRPKVGS